MSNLTGALSSLLMSLPLIAVPCLAVFGLPSIGPATAEADAEEGLELGSVDGLGRASSTPPKSSAGGFGEIVNADPTSPPTSPFAIKQSGDRSEIDTTSIHLGSGANRPLGLDDEQPERKASPNTEPSAKAVVDDAFGDVRAPEESPFGDAETDQQSWEEIVAELSAQGLEFYLTSGETPGEYYFTCFIGTGANATQRFEAEGTSPTAAASAVLAEVEEWQASR